jgi:hypothetical protein
METPHPETRSHISFTAFSPSRNVSIDQAHGSPSFVEPPGNRAAYALCTTSGDDNYFSFELLV